MTGKWQVNYLDLLFEETKCTLDASPTCFGFEAVQPELVDYFAHVLKRTNFFFRVLCFPAIATSAVLRVAWRSRRQAKIKGC